MFTYNFIISYYNLEYQGINDPNFLFTDLFDFWFHIWVLRGSESASGPFEYWPTITFTSRNDSVTLNPRSEGLVPGPTNAGHLLSPLPNWGWRQYYGKELAPFTSRFLDGEEIEVSVFVPPIRSWYTNEAMPSVSITDFNLVPLSGFGNPSDMKIIRSIKGINPGLQKEIHDAYIERQCRPAGEMYYLAKESFYKSCDQLQDPISIKNDIINRIS